MPGPSNCLNIVQQGTIYFNGTNQFSGIDGSTTGKVLTSNGTGVAPSFQTASASGISTINGDSGSITGSTVTIYANNAGNVNGATVKFVNSGTASTLNVTDGVANTLMGLNAGNLTLSGIANTGFGQQALGSLTSGFQNTAQGNAALLSMTSGNGNSGFGYLAGQGITTGVNNNAFGVGSLSATGSGVNNNAFGALALQLCTGSYNLAIGNSSLQALLTGSYNTAIGEQAGVAYNGGEIGNIIIGPGVSGTAGENQTIRVGNTQSATYIAGISGATVTGTAVLCSASGQLGTVVSSERYKENIVDMPKDVSVMNLRPVRFNYKKDFSPEHFQETQYGLIAEEVAKEFPHLCFYKDEKPESVKYHELCVFLLSELQRLEARVKNLEVS